MAEIKDPENTIIMELKDGRVVIELLPDVAPKHTARIKELARAGKYDNVAFHRVIEGFMAQTGDVEYGHHGRDTSRAGMPAQRHAVYQGENSFLSAVESAANGAHPAPRPKVASGRPCARPDHAKSPRTGAGNVERIGGCE